MYLPVSAMPLKSSNSKKLDKKSRSENVLGAEEVETSDGMLSNSLHFQMFQGVCIQTPMISSHTSVTGMNIFQPNRMIWS